MLRRIHLFILVVLLVVLAIGPRSVMAQENRSTDQKDRLFALASDALISANDQNFAKTAEAVEALKQIWGDAPDAGKEAESVSAVLSKAEQVLKASPPDSARVREAVSGLAKAIDAYLTAEKAEKSLDQARQQAMSLVTLLDRSLSQLSDGNAAGAKLAFSSFISGWSKAEGAIRADNAKVYGALEVRISQARVALQTEPFDSAKAKSRLQELADALGRYVSGTAEASEPGPGKIGTIADLLPLLDQVGAAIASQKQDEAAAGMDRFIESWPAVEGEVSARSSQAYSRIETLMVSVPSMLGGEPPNWKQAAETLAQLKLQLEPYAQAAGYTAWDAGIILFREGLEAILILSALLAFLERSGNSDKRKWIWTGAGTGVAVSGVLAIILTFFLSNLSTGSSRELMEGLTGLVAVVFMVTIGAWLHKKSNVRAWNRFVEQSIGQSVARGALWSLAFTAFLSVLREGAETILFYVGMASTIHLGDLLLGVGVAVIILAFVGYGMMKLSARIPIRYFFLIASLLLYYLAFKFVGVSVHALQVSGRIAAHASSYLWEWTAAGLYATWETTIPQAVVILVILGSVARVEWRKRMGGGVEAS